MKLVEKEIKKTDMFLVKPENIVLNPDNVRVDMGGIEELMLSIVDMGLQVPLVGKKVRGEEKFILVDGHRRMRAILLALEKGYEIPYVKLVAFNGSDEDQLFAMVITGSGQKPLTELEQAEAFKKLVNYEYSVEEIARKIGKSVPHIYNMLKLANVSKAIKNKVAENLISAGTVVQIIRQTDSQIEQVELVNEAIENANKDIVEGEKPKKATAKNVTKLKAKTPIQKLKELSVEIKSQGIETEKAEFVKLLVEQLKDSSVEELLELVK